MITFFNFILYLLFAAQYADLKPTEDSTNHDISAVGLLENATNSDNFSKDAHSNKTVRIRNSTEKVSITLVYESHCPACKNFYAEFLRVVEKLHPYLSIETNPYGHTETTTKEDGTYEFDCQHGGRECYGGMLHSCSLFELGTSRLDAYRYIGCLMKPVYGGSDAKTADECGKTLNVDAESIKSCVEPNGPSLLESFGVKSRDIDYSVVPTFFINDVENDKEQLFKDVCAAFKNPPVECDDTSSSLEEE